MRLAMLSFAIASGLSGNVVATPALRVGGEPALVTKSDGRDAFRAPDFAALPAAILRFQTLDVRRIDALHRHNASEGKRLQIGIGRESADELDRGAASAVLSWRAVPHGHVARVDVAAPDAKGLRVGLDLRSLPDTAELRVAGNGQPTSVFAEVVGVAKQRLDAEGRFWTAVTDGEIQLLEVFVPSGSPRPSALAVSSISHLLVAPNSVGDFAKALGDSGNCNIDVACRTTALGQHFVNAKNAVARMIFTSGSSSFTCTGTLLNDNVASTQVPYFYSAAHCLSSQTVANTLTTFWNNETPTCNVDNSGSNTQVAGGAQLLFANTSSDVLFVRLNNAPPVGAYYAGWDASTLSPGTATTAIHHPAGDIKKVSQGNHSGFTSFSGGSYARSSWSEGTTEGGSSGSGLFTVIGGQYYHRGGLQGGSASCSNTGLSEGAGNVDYYSRLDQAYPSISGWLGAQTAIGPSRDNGGAWYNATAGESGWGLTVFQYTGQVFILVFVYDSAGRPNWYRMQGPWTGPDTAINLALDKPNLAGGWGNSFNTSNISYTTVGSASITFNSATSASFSFNAEGVNRTVTLTKIQ